MLKEVKTNLGGCWNSFLYVDGRTGQLHTERDCTYILITVPKHTIIKNIPLCNNSVFLFKFGESEQIMLPLLSNTSFIYNGKFVTHR